MPLHLLCFVSIREIYCHVTSLFMIIFGLMPQEIGPCLFYQSPSQADATLKRCSSATQIWCILDTLHTIPHTSYVPISNGTNGTLLDICKAVLYYKDIYARE